MKWRIREFRLFELPAMEDWFRRMAEKGWMIRKIHGGNFFGFEKIEPSKISFSAEVIGDMSVLSADDCEEALDYREYCERAGWKFVCASRVVQVFSSPEEEKRVPIETDEKLKFEAVWRQCRKTLISEWLLAAIWLFWALYLPDYEMLLQSFTVSYRILLLAAGVFFLLDGFRNFQWYLRGRKAFAAYRPVEYYGWKKHVIFGSLWLAMEAFIIIGFFFCLLYLARTGGFRRSLYHLIYFAFYLAFLLTLQGLIKRRGFSKAGYAAAAVVGAVVLTFSMLGVWNVIEDSKIPDGFPGEEQEEKWLLTEADLGLPAAKEEFELNSTDSSLFGSRQEYHIYQEDCMFDYYLYETGQKWLLEKLKEELLKPYKRDYGDTYRSYVTEPVSSVAGVNAFSVCDQYMEADTGEILSKDHRGYLLETEEILLYLSFFGPFEKSEEEILQTAAKKLKARQELRS